MEIEKRELYNFIVEEDFNGGYKVIKGPLKNTVPSVAEISVPIGIISTFSTRQRLKIFENKIT